MLTGKGLFFMAICVNRTCNICSEWNFVYICRLYL